MHTSLLLVLLLLWVFPAIARKFMHVPENVAIIFRVQPLLLAAMSVVFFVGGLVSVAIAPSPSLSTLPITTMILGIATNTLPAAYFLKRFGRKNGTYLGLTVGLIGALLAMLATMHASFWLFIGATFLMGGSISYVQQLRFAAIESSKNVDSIPQIVSLLMIGGIFSAFIGPEVAVVSKNWIPSPHGYSGSFLALAILIVVAMALFSRFKNPVVNEQHFERSSRPLKELIKQPVFIIAALSGAIGYAVMSFVMTGTPISMHIAHHLSLNDTKWVLQSHIAAMYLPSFLMGYFFKRFGVNQVIFSGIIIYGFMVVVALQGQQVMHYWFAMVLLGAGWNCLFTSGTVLLPNVYQPQERFKVQAVNDFSVFGSQAIASLSAGWIIFSFGWDTMLYSVIPMLVLMLLVLIWYSRSTLKNSTHKAVS